MNLKIKSPEVLGVSVSADQAVKISKNEKNTHKYLSFLRSFVCEQQGEIAHGVFLSLEFHKRIRKSLDVNDLNGAVDAFNDLNRVSEYHLKSSWKACVAFSREFYSIYRKESQYRPRLCLKATKPSSNGTIFTDLYRDEDYGLTGNVSNIDESTAFTFIKNNDRWYMCNNIPYAISNENYKNRRIDQAKALKYYGAGRVKRFIREKNEACLDWAKCWVDYKEGESPNKYYRSTLVVPLTIVNTSTSSEFDEYTILGISKVSEKTTYGFICFDHPSVNFFDQISVDLGYIMADLISFQFMARHSLIEHSQTIERLINAKKSLKNKINLHAFAR